RSRARPAPDEVPETLCPLLAQALLTAVDTDPVLLREIVDSDRKLAHQITSARVSSVFWKYANPPARSATTTMALVATTPKSGRSVPISAQRNPSITPAIGLRLYRSRQRSGTRLTG